MKDVKKILFITGTRADYGKIKSLMKILDCDDSFEVHIFATGMHMLRKYGLTYIEIEKDGFSNIHLFNNQDKNSSMDIVFSNTISGFSQCADEISPDAIVVHGDRLEALAGAVVGALRNIRVMHIEGGEVSGTIDESIRHAITKFSHFHFVSNEKAKRRIMQLGEYEENIFILGSPDIDIMHSKRLPSIDEVKKYYEIPFNHYNILIYHPVTTEINDLNLNIKSLIGEVLKSQDNYVVIYPNNDLGSEIILNEYDKLKDNENFRIIPSMRFEYFLTLLKHTDCIVGNSSAGIREAGIYAIPAVDIGTRQKGRYDVKSTPHIIHVNENESVIPYINKAKQLKLTPKSDFGDGNSDKMFYEIFRESYIWQINVQKQFIDIDF